MPEAFVRLKFRAVSAVEEAVRRYPEDPMSWYALGEWRMATSRGPLPGRRPCHSRPSPAQSRWIRGSGQPTSTCRHCSWSLGRPEEARRSAATYLALDPTSPHRSETRLAALLLDPSATGRAEAERMLDTASVFTVWGAVIRPAARLLARHGRDRNPAAAAPRRAGPGRRWRPSVGPRLGHVAAVPGSRARVPRPPARGLRGG